jgi:hypothetical protein
MYLEHVDRPLHVACVADIGRFWLVLSMLDDFYIAKDRGSARRKKKKPLNRFDSKTSSEALCIGYGPNLNLEQMA